jgi:hypothetical protein
VELVTPLLVDAIATAGPAEDGTDGPADEPADEPAGQPEG